VNSPEWVRFLGYAGISIVVAFPAFIVAVATAYRLLRTHMTNRTNYINSLQTRSAQLSGVAATPKKVPHYKLARAVAPATNKVNSPASMYGANFAVPGSPVGKGNLSITSSPMSGMPHLPPLSPMFQPGRALSIQTVSDYPDEGSVDGTKPPHSPAGSYPSYHVPFGRRPVPQLTQSERDAYSEAGYNMDVREKIPESPEEDSDRGSLDEENRAPASHAHHSFVQSRTGAHSNSLYSPPPNLIPAIWRLAVFQIAFFGIEMLAALSTIIDVIQKRPEPMPFGTHHVALILAAWGPLIVFGHLPSVRTYVTSHLAFWRK